MSPLLVDAALAYAALGWRVLPLHTSRAGGCACRRGPACCSPGKHPRTAHGSHDATTDLKLIRSWWAKCPSANIGIATGHQSDLLVLDIDPRNGGHTTLVSLEEKLGLLPPTAIVKTGGGGWHRFFRAPPLQALRGTLGPGIDVKFEGGYVVAAPSRHASGVDYAWAGGSLPTHAIPSIAHLPIAWLRALPPTSRALAALPTPTHAADEEDAARERRARQYARKIEPAISGRRGHHATFRAALLVVRGFDLDPPTAFRVLRDEWNPSCEPPWSENELRRKVDDAFARSTAPRGFLLTSGRLVR